MKEVRDLLASRSVWLRGEGPESDTVLSSRIRFARNLSGRMFPQQATAPERADLLGEILDKTQGLQQFPEELRLSLEPLEPLDRRLLGERQLLSHELVESPRFRGVVIAANESVSFMINEEDHLRIQALRSGFDLERAHAAGDALDNELDGRLDFAFTKTFGFLTACPTNAGTGMRASVLMHLPALVLGQRVEEELQALRTNDLTVRGFQGEGSSATGNFFQISNAVTLGVGEKDILEKLRKAARDLIAKEKQAREDLASRARTLLEDRIWRSFGILSQARVLSSQETLHHASLLRLGHGMKIVEVPMAVLNDILNLSQEAHAQVLAGSNGSEVERGAWRAEQVRKKLRDSKA
ncbi:MAG: ATP--guanido phosphotransferase [Candidatus Krumholzibacteriia bacterium]